MLSSINWWFVFVAGRQCRMICIIVLRDIRKIRARGPATSGSGCLYKICNNNVETASESVICMEGKTGKKNQHICIWTGISRLAVLLCLKRNIEVMSCCFCRMTQIRSFVLDAQSLNHAFISTRLAELFILGIVAEINWPPAALNLTQQWTCSQKCDPICCNLMSLYNVFSACGKV